MAISATYIGVIILLVILIGFVLTVIRTLAKSAGTRIRHDMNNLLSSYDDLINEKTAAYKDIENKGREERLNILKVKQHENDTAQVVVKETNTISASSFVKKEVKHRDSALADGYDSIKGEFRDYENEADENINIISNYIENTAFDESLQKILEGLTVENVYELSLDNSDSQLEFFKDTLSKKDMAVLDKYLEVTHKKKFSTIDFYDWVKTRSKEMANKLEVRSGNKGDKKAIFEPSICEGYQIITGDKLYDYSISKRDIQ